MALVSLIVSLCLTVSEAGAASSPLFANGVEESFRIIETKTQKPPQILVLNDDQMQISMAGLIGKALNFPSDDKGLTLKLEQLTFTPFNNTKNLTASPNRLKLRAKVSGRDFALEQTLSKADFVKGKLITIKFPEETNETPVMTLTSSGQVTLKYVGDKDVLEIPHGDGTVVYDSKLGVSGTRHLNFVGQGKRVVKP